MTRPRRPEILRFERADDGALIARHFPEFAAVSDALLETLSEHELIRDGDTMTFVVATGRAVYEVTGRDTSGRPWTYLALRESDVEHTA